MSGPVPPEVDRTYKDAVAAADERSVQGVEAGARMIGAYYLALVQVVANQQFALDAAQHLAIIWERGVEASMAEERERLRDAQ